MLNTWDGAVEFAGSGISDLELANLLGWTRKADGKGQRMTHGE